MVQEEIGLEGIRPCNGILCAGTCFLLLGHLSPAFFRGCLSSVKQMLSDFFDFVQGVGNGIKKLEFCTRFASYATDEVNAMPRDRSPLSCSSDKEQSCSPGRKSVCPAAQLTDWCDVQTFLKWAWVVFQLDLLQVRCLVAVYVFFSSLTRSLQVYSEACCFSCFLALAACTT